MSVSGTWSIPGSSFAILVHGGAGRLAEADVSLHVEGCRRAADAALTVLRQGASALTAVERAVCVLEDDPLFNAGNGAALNREGWVELDAAIMEGTALRAGAICALPPFRHPISIARKVLESGEHLLYAAHGAERFALEAGFERLADDALITDRARHSLANVLDRHGTVGAVARDARGALAAATSTGGTAGKRPGRVGDSPILGAGTYADDAAGAASATGWGEGILRIHLTGAMVEWMRGGDDALSAARRGIEMLGHRVGATAGVIAVDRQGRLGLARSTETMPWAAAGPDWTANGA
jgi:L-asparaginase / beta-aspartyl-peptidase